MKTLFMIVLGAAGLVIVVAIAIIVATAILAVATMTSRSPLSPLAIAALCLAGLFIWVILMAGLHAVARQNQPRPPDVSVTDTTTTRTPATTRPSILWPHGPTSP